MDFPSELKYTKTHEWIRIEKNNEVVIGISDYAAHELGDIVYLELPEEAEVLEKDNTLGVIESTKATEDIYSPVSGTVLESNAPLLDSPEVLNDDPYGDGWLLKIELSNPDELKELMDINQYKAYLEEIAH
jgi:glycine cleavage system H protein